MRRKAKIATPIARRMDNSCRMSIPKGPCEIDAGPHGTGPYIVYWNEGGRIVSSELTLTEFVSYVYVEVQPWTNLSGRTHDQMFARDRPWTNH